MGVKADGKFRYVSFRSNKFFSNLFKFIFLTLNYFQSLVNHSLQRQFDDSKYGAVTLDSAEYR